LSATITPDPHRLWNDSIMISRRSFFKHALSASIAGIAGAAYGNLIEPNRLSLERVSVPIPNLPESLQGTKIAVLSDFHLHPFTKIEHIQAAVDLANANAPDICVLLGDYVDATVDAIHELAPVLGRLNPRFGVFGVLGNHDYWKGRHVVRDALRKSGVTVLENSGLLLQIGSHPIFLAGLESAWAGHPNINLALSKRREADPVILMMHEPDFADTAAADGRIALQLSGHSHGGQVRVPLVGAIRLPSWGRKYDQGLYKLDGMRVYTNRGIGMVKHPVRFNCPPEVTVMTLMRESVVL